MAWELYAFANALKMDSFRRNSIEKVFQSINGLKNANERKKPRPVDNRSSLERRVIHTQRSD